MKLTQNITLSWRWQVEERLLSLSYSDLRSCSEVWIEYKVRMGI